MCKVLQYIPVVGVMYLGREFRYTDILIKGEKG